MESSIVNKNLYTYWFILITLCIMDGCADPAKRAIDTVKVSQKPFPDILIPMGLECENMEISCVPTATHIFFYIGPRRDSFYIDKDSFYSQSSIYGEAYKSPYRLFGKYAVDRWYRSVDSSNVSVQVDTSQLLFSRHEVFILAPLYKAYPVLLTNSATDTIQIGYGDFMYITMEARDRSGKWRPIERRFTPGCGHGIKNIILPPGEVVLTSAIIYQGNYKTRLRLKLGKNYSKEFSGSINYGQFTDYELPE